MYHALASISGDDKICRATIESIICHLATFWNGDTREVGATRESTAPNLRHRWGDGDAREAGASIESTYLNLRHRGGDGDAHEARAITESTPPNLRYRWGDGDAF